MLGKFTANHPHCRGRGMMPGVGFIGGQLSILGGYSWPGAVDLIETWDEDRSVQYSTMNSTVQYSTMYSTVQYRPETGMREV